MEELTRAAGLDRLRRFAPQMGGTYAARRNYDLGAGAHRDVSGLSPWLRRRLLTEAEVVGMALDTHGLRGAEKFVQEVVWRTYFKGWLEQRPAIWAAYKADVCAALEDPAVRGRAEAVEAGRCGIACMDAWARELVDTGYLHNHARMWFASIWVFTLGLPWALGADFFLRHLLDGDPASNTLSWRWVVGLHTVGKVYTARADNIARYTEGRFGPVTGLAADPAPVAGVQVPRAPLRAPLGPTPGARRLRLITEEDAHPESLGALEVAGVFTLQLSRARSPREVSGAVVAADRQALADAGARAGGPTWVLENPTPETLVAAAQEAGVEEIVTGFVPTGWVRDWLVAAEPALHAAGLRVVEQQRPWDAAFWPHCDAGFFRVKKAIPTVLRDLRADPSDLPLFANGS